MNLWVMWCWNEVGRGWGGGGWCTKIGQVRTRGRGVQILVICENVIIEWPPTSISGQCFLIHEIERVKPVWHWFIGVLFPYSRTTLQLHAIRILCKQFFFVLGFPRILNSNSKLQIWEKFQNLYFKIKQGDL